MSLTRIDSWVDVMEDTSLVITDVGILSKKEKVPQTYTVLENTHDGKKANFPEGRLGFTTRYICYTKKSASPQRGFVVVTELKVMSINDKSPLGFLPLIHTMDDNSKAFQSRQLLVRFVALEEATEAISDIIILSSQKKEEVPPKYKRLPEINGFSICYKVGPVPKKSSTKTKAEEPVPASSEGGGFPIHRDKGSTKLCKAIDGLSFKLSQEKDMVKQYRLDENFKMLTVQDIENQYNLDFGKWKSLVHQT